MNYGAQITVWAVATMLPLTVNLMTNRRADALGISGMIIISWGVSMACWALWSPPEAMQLYPVIDALCGAATFAAWLTRRAWWKLALLGVFITQCALHAAFWSAWEIKGHDPMFVWRYTWGNNALYACAIVCAAWPGGTYVASRAVRWLLGRARAVHPMGS